MNSSISIVIMTWNRPASMLENSLWTLSHQTTPPLEIVVAEVSPSEAIRQDTRALCARYPLVRLLEGSWHGFNVSRGFNVGIRNSSGQAGWVAAAGMELLFAENFLEAVARHMTPGVFIRPSCGSLWQDTDTSQGPEHVRAHWEEYCGRARPYPPHLAYGAFVCAERDWWLRMRGYDEARRPYSYPDIDIRDRAIRSGLVDTGIGWDETQCLHPYHPPSPLFYSVSGYPVDAAGVDKEVIRNSDNWGTL